jgi:hypothetical protein
MPHTAATVFLLGRTPGGNGDGSKNVGSVPEDWFRRWFGSVHRQVDRGSSLNLEGSDAHGTTFTVTLPATSLMV